MKLMPETSTQCTDNHCGERIWSPKRKNKKQKKKKKKNYIAIQKLNDLRKPHGPSKITTGKN